MLLAILMPTTAGRPPGVPAEVPTGGPGPMAHTHTHIRSTADRHCNADDGQLMSDDSGGRSVLLISTIKFLFTVGRFSFVFVL